MSRPRLVLVGLALCLVTAAACNKQGGSTAPGATQGDKAAAGELVIAYADKPIKLKQVGQFDVDTTGAGQFGQLAIAFSAGLEFVPQGDKRKVLWSLSGVDKLDVKGMFAGEAGDDPKPMLIELGKGAFVIDAHGEVDDEAATSLEENRARKEKFEAMTKAASEAAKAGKQVKPPAGAQVLGMADAMLKLPGLPTKGLTPGKTTVIEDKDEAALGPMKLPTESETKYTLVKIDDAGGKRIAEIQIEGVTSGALEVQGQMVTVDMSSEGTMLFDIDAGVPVSYQFTTSQAFAFGDQTFETTILSKGTYEPA